MREMKYLVFPFVLLASQGCSPVDRAFGDPGGGGGTGPGSTASTGAEAQTSIASASSGVVVTTGSGLQCGNGVTMCAGVCVATSSDPANCGRCGHDCDKGTCQNGVCQPFVLAKDQGKVTCVAVDATSVYWSSSSLNNGDGIIAKAPIHGGQPTLLASRYNVPNTFQMRPQCLAVDAKNVYWTCDVQADCFLFSVPIGGGATKPLNVANGSSDLVVDATSVFWTTPFNGGIKKISTDGSNFIKLVPSGPEYPNRIAIDATSVYWTSQSDDMALGSTVRKVSIQGGPVTTLASGYKDLGGIAVDATNVYWVSSASGTVMKMPKGGGTPVELAAAQASPFSIAVDDKNVYWTNNASASVMAVPIEGGPPVTLAGGQPGAYGIALDATSVYWANNQDGTVMKVTKP